MSHETKKPLFRALKTRTLIRITGIFLCTSFCVRIVHYSLTDGFSLKRIESPISFQGDLSIKQPSKAILNDLCSISKQHFSYLKKGSQAYAFLSDDGKYILKLFKLHHMRPADWLQDVPLPSFLQSYRDNLVRRRRYRIELTLTSYKLAAESLAQECALIYAQIRPNSSYSIPITIKDSAGRTYTIDLAQHGFALQRRANLVPPSFIRWIKDKDIASAKRAIDSLVALIAQRSSKGIQDSDPDLHKNAGLIGTSAIFIDIGSFYANPAIKNRAEMQRDLKKVFFHFSVWLSKRSPELRDYLQSRLNAPEELHWSPPESE